VVSRHVVDAGAPLEHPEDAADHVARRIGPDEVAPQFPAVDDVADEVEIVGLEAAEELKQLVGPGKPAAQMDVGDE